MGEKNIPQEIPEKPTESQAALAGHTLATLAAPGAAAWEPRNSPWVFLLVFSLFWFGKDGGFSKPRKFSYPPKV